jgi:hypothetical protein
VSHSDPLTNGDEELFRQLVPTWRHEDKITSQLFLPTRKDEGLLSIDRGSKVGPKQAFDDHTALGLQSAGVFAVTVDEVANQAGLTAHDDPLPEKPHHGFIAMDELPTRGAREKKAQLLRDFAVQRGARYEPPSALRPN